MSDLFGCFISLLTSYTCKLVEVILGFMNRSFWDIQSCILLKVTWPSCHRCFGLLTCLVLQSMLIQYSSNSCYRFFLSIEINFNSQAFFLFIIFYALEEISWLKTLSKSWEFPDHKISLLISLKALLFVFIKSLCLKMGISMK